jgi:DNA repair protein RadC
LLNIPLNSTQYQTNTPVYRNYVKFTIKTSQKNVVNILTFQSQHYLLKDEHQSSSPTGKNILDIRTIIKYEIKIKYKKQKVNIF